MQYLHCVEKLSAEETRRTPRSARIAIDIVRYFF